MTMDHDDNQTDPPRQLSGAPEPPRNLSGFDIDVWGDDRPTTPLLVPDPHNGQQDCHGKVDGICPAGCRLCLQFLEDLKP